MSEFYKYFSSDKILLFGFGIGIFCIMVSLVFIFIFFRALPPLIPLFYQMPWGESRLGTRDQLFIPVSFAIVIAAGNALCIAGSYEKMPFLSRILSITSLLTSTFALLITMRVVLLMV